MSEWISVNERMPEQFQTVIACATNEKHHAPLYVFPGEEMAALKAQRDQLREALEEMVATFETRDWDEPEAVLTARAALNATEGK